MPSNPVGLSFGVEAVLLCPFAELGGGGKLGAAVLADAKSKLSSNAESNEILGAEDATPLLGIFPIASSKAFTPAIGAAGAAVGEAGNGLEALVRGAPKASVDGASEVNEEAKLSVGAVDDSFGVSKVVDSEPDISPPKASLNEVEGISIPLSGATLEGVLSADVCNLCFTSDKGSSSLSLSDSSMSSSLRGPLRSVSPS
jgi:hypothetical protein